MKIQTEGIDFHINFRFKISLWDSIKLRLAGRNAQALIEIIVDQIESTREPEAQE